MIYTFMPGISETGIPPKGLPYLKRVFVDKDIRGNEGMQRWDFVQAFSWDNIEWARKELAQDGVDEEEFYSWDNDTRREYFITRTSYGATLNALTNQALRDAWLYGKWDIFQGQYFPNFSREKHLISRTEAAARMKPWHKRWLSGDWGFDHPHCVLWHCEDEHGHIITYREQWGREVGESELGRLVTEQSQGEKLIAFPFSWDAGKLSKRSQRTHPKSSIQLLADELGKDMPRPFPADSSPGSRISGWRLMYQLLDNEMWQIVEDDCPNLVDCLPSLIRDPDNTEDVLKTDFVENQIGDDPADAARMGLQYMLGSAVKPFEVRLQERLKDVPIEGTGRYIAHLQFNQKEKQDNQTAVYFGRKPRRH
jgi:hypothetical protein